MYAIKFRAKGSKSWWFATARGDSTRLRIHAARFDSEATVEAIVATDRAANPELEFKVVKL